MYCCALQRKGEEVARNVVNVGALQMAETRMFTLSVDVMPPKGVAGVKRG